MENNVYVRKNSRLALYRKKATQEYWEKNWSSMSEMQLKRTLRTNGSLSTHKNFFKKFLPMEGIILEAGCGSGLWVKRMIDNKYNCIGLDYAGKTLFRSKKIAPEMPLINGDVFKLPFRDQSLSAYLSFGVIEHFENGPYEILKEVFRVLIPGGIALISVPLENRYRTKIVGNIEDDAVKGNMEFYQYYFTRKDILKELKSAGLEPDYNTKHYYAAHMGLREQNRLIRYIMNRIPCKSCWTPILDKIPYFSHIWAHMIFTVARKPVK